MTQTATNELVIPTISAEHPPAPATPGMTRDELLALPSTVDIGTTARALGIGRTVAYALAKREELPVRVLRLGVQYRVLTSDLLRVLGVATPSQ